MMTWERLEHERLHAEALEAKRVEEEQLQTARQKKEKLKAERLKLEHDLHAIGLKKQVTILPPMPTLEELLANYVSEYIVENIDWHTAIYARKTGKEDIKVQLLADGSVTCSGQHGIGMCGTCGHIADFCICRGLPIPGGYFSTALRLDPAFDIYPKGEGRESTKRNQAHRRAGMRAREFAYTLCNKLEDPRDKKTTCWWREPSNAGRPKAPFKCLVYAAILKIYFNGQYFDLRDILLFDPYFRALGWTSVDAPHENTLYKIMDEPIVLDTAQKFLVTIARKGRLLDYAVAFDGSGLGIRFLVNWLAEKHGKKTRSERGGRKGTDTKIDLPAEDSLDISGEVSVTSQDWTGSRKRRSRKRDFIKVNTAYGLQSGFIYGIIPTPSIGAGTHDNVWFEPLWESVVNAGADPDMTIVDLGYFDEDNYALMQGLNKLLFVAAKRGTDVANMEIGRELAAYMDALREQRPDIYRRFSRLRPKIESVFAAVKNRGSQLRLRTRKWEKERIEALSKDPIEPKSSASKQTKDLYQRICRMLATERVGYARRTEATLKGVCYNLRRLVRLEAKHGIVVDLNDDSAIQPRRQVELPRSA